MMFDDCDDVPLIDITVEIRRNVDGVTVTDQWAKWRWAGAYWWTEGNASCDCNRHIFFNNVAKGEVREGDSQCGKGRYSVRITDTVTKAILYDDISTKPTRFL